MKLATCEGVENLEPWKAEAVPATGAMGAMNGMVKRLQWIGGVFLIMRVQGLLPPQDVRAYQRII